MALSTVSGILTRSGSAAWEGSGLNRPSATNAHDRASSFTSTSRARPVQGGASWRLRGGRQHYGPTFADRDRHRRTTVGNSKCMSQSTTQRLAYAEVLPDEKATTAIGFLRRAVAF